MKHNTYEQIFRSYFRKKFDHLKFIVNSKIIVGIR